MNAEDRAWLRSEADDCIDSWRAVVDTEGPHSRDALLWEGRADQALRAAIHFGLIEPEDGRRRMATVTPDAAVLRALSEPDGE